MLIILTVISGLRLVLGPRLLLGLCELLGHRLEDSQEQFDVVVGDAHVQRVETYLENEEIGTMKVNEEIDALTTLGISPFEILTLPRLLGLMIAFPLLTIWADIFGVLGGMTMASIGLDGKRCEEQKREEQEDLARHGEISIQLDCISRLQLSS